MKKLLATLLVAVMLISCMSVVSFAAGSTIYTLSAFGFANVEYTEGKRVNTYDDPFTSAYYDQVTTYDEDLVGEFIYAMDDYLYAGETTALPTELKAGDYVAVPVYVDGDGIMAFTIVLDEVNELEYVESISTSELGLKLGDDGVTLGATASANQSGLLAINFYKVKDGLTTENADGTKEIEVGYTVEVARGAGAVDATVGTSSMTVKLAGLEVVGGGSSEPTDITEAEVKAITPVVVGTFEATNMVADIKTAYGVDVTLADEFDAENMSYIPVFASIPTENKNAPAAYGIIIKGEGVEELKIPVTNAVDGKFGVVLYGFTGHIEKYTEAYLYVTVGESTYTSALGDL